MKQIYKYALIVICLMLASSSFISCEFDTSPEYDHPLYVTYSITADDLSFDGPDELLVDILAWIKENSLNYDEKVNYSTGAASEFAKEDAEAISKYEVFVPKFHAYLAEVSRKLASGTYGNGAVVSAVFCTYAKRVQGEGGNLKYDEFNFSYPSSTAQ